MLLSRAPRLTADQKLAVVERKLKAKRRWRSSVHAIAALHRFHHGDGVDDSDSDDEAKKKRGSKGGGWVYNDPSVCGSNGEDASVFGGPTRHSAFEAVSGISRLKDLAHNAARKQRMEDISKPLRAMRPGEACLARHEEPGPGQYDTSRQLSFPSLAVREEEGPRGRRRRGGCRIGPAPSSALAVAAARAALGHTPAATPGPGAYDVGTAAKANAASAGGVKFAAPRVVEAAPGGNGGRSPASLLREREPPAYPGPGAYDVGAGEHVPGGRMAPLRARTRAEEAFFRARAEQQQPPGPGAYDTSVRGIGGGGGGGNAPKMGSPPPLPARDEESGGSRPSPGPGQHDVSGALDRLHRPRGGLMALTGHGGGSLSSSLGSGGGGGGDQKRGGKVSFRAASGGPGPGGFVRPRSSVPGGRFSLAEVPTVTERLCAVSALLPGPGEYALRSGLRSRGAVRFAPPNAEADPDRERVLRQVSTQGTRCCTPQTCARGEN